MADANQDMSFSEKALRHGASEIASVPGAIPALVGIAETGVRMLGGQDFAEAALSDDGRKLARILMDDNAPPELQNAAQQLFDPQKHMNWGLRNAAEWYDFGTRWGGNLDSRIGLSDSNDEFERRPGEVPLDEEIAGIAIAALPGLPAKIVTTLGTKISQKLGQVAGQQFVTRMIQSTPGRISGKVVGAAGYMVPGTFPWTPGNVALNIGASTALNDVMRNMTGETSLIGDVTGENERIRQEAETNAPITTQRAREMAAIEVSLNGLDEPSVTENDTGAHRYIDYGNLLITGGVTGLAILGAAALRGRVASPSAGSSFLKDTAGPNPNLSTEQPKLDQVITDARAVDTRLFDSTSSIVSAARAAGGDAAAESIEVMAGANTRAGAEQMLNNVATMGIVGDTGVKVPPLQLLQQAIGSLSKKRTFTHGITNLKKADSEYEFFSIATHARQALSDRATLRTRANDAFTQESNRLARMLASGKYTTRQLNEQMAAVNKAQSINTASASMHPQFADLTDNDLQRMVNIVDSHPRMIEVDDMISDFSRKMLDAEERFGIIDSSFKQQKLSQYGYVSKSGKSGVSYRPLYEDADAGETRKGVRRLLSTGRDLFRPQVQKKNTGQPMNERELDPAEFFDAATKGEPRKTVNNPGDITARLYDYTGNMLRNASHNSVIREFVDLMASSPATSGSLRKVQTVTKAQLNSGKYVPASNHVRVQRGNTYEFWEFGDGVLAESLAFNPYQVTPFFNWARRTYQVGTTGPFAPFWAPKGFLYDYSTALLTKPKGRSLGYLDAAVNRLSNGKLGVPGDPTFLLESLVGVGRGVYGSNVKALGDWFVNDLAQSSGVFSQLARTAVGKQWLENVGLKLHDTYLRTTLGMMDIQGRFGSSAVSLKNPHDVGLMNANFAQSLGARAWMGMFNSIHNGVKIAYFARNYTQMQAKLGRPLGLDDIRKLTHEARTLAGDMSKSGMSTYINATTSTMPYANVYIQSMRHVLIGSTKRALKGDFGPVMGLFFGTFLPGFLGMQALSRMNEQQDGAVLDWFYNKLPPWQRVSGLFMPNPLSENTGPFDPATDIWELSIAPELVPLMQVARAFAESLNIIDGSQRITGGLHADTLDAFGTLANLSMPPPISGVLEANGYRAYLGDAIAGVFGGTGRAIVGKKPGLKGAVDEDAMRLNSDISRDMRDALTAVFGTSMNMIINSLDAGLAADEDTKNISDAIGQTLRQLAFETQKRVPVANRALWNIDTTYRGNPVTERYFSTISAMQKAFRMDEAQSAGVVGGKTKPPIIYPWSDRPDLIKRPVDGIPPEVLRAAVAVSKQMLENGAAKELSSEIGRIDRSITMVDGNRAMDPRKRHDTLQELMSFRNRYATGLYTTIIQPWEKRMTDMLGKQVDAQEFISIIDRGTGE